MGIFDLELDDPLERVKAFWEIFASRDAKGDDYPWDTVLSMHIVPHSAIRHSPTTCTVTFILTVHATLCNSLRNLHGGCAATIFDLLTSVSIAPVAREGRFAFGGVSRSLSCTYLRPIPEDTHVLVTCEVVNLGARLCHTRGEMREWDDETKAAKGDILCLCEHGKVNTDSKL